MCFPRRSLPICKDSPIKPFDHTVDDWSSRVLIYILLSAAGIKDFIEWKLEAFSFPSLFIILFFRIFDGNSLIIKQLVHYTISQGFFSFI